MILTPWQKYKTEKAQKKNSELRISGAYAIANNIGIVFHNNAQAKIEEAEKLGTLIKMDGKKVKIIAYEHKSSIKHLPYDTFTRANFDFWGGFVGKPILDFVNAEFDFLICLDQEPNTLVKSVLANSNAKCRIGRLSEESQDTFEMLFDASGEGVEWIEKLYQYLKKLS